MPGKTGGERVYTNPRIEKLGVKPLATVLLVGEHDADFVAELRAKDVALAAADSAEKVALVFVRADDRAALELLPAVVPRMRRDGALWVVRLRGHATMTEGDVFRAGQDAGLVDVKVVRFSETHSALKFVYRLADR